MAAAADSAAFDYDFAVIGGGSGGMASAKEAARLGARVILFDYVKPSTQGTKWGIGGTCVNVGCVPKKIMHYAGLCGASRHDAEKLGWVNACESTHDWVTLRNTVRNFVRSLNFGYRGGLRSANVKYVNALASFKDKHTIQYGKPGAEAQTCTAAHILIAVGGRPFVPSDVPGAIENSITSDDIFYMDKAPGRTLCVGAGYISLETAGFLQELGYDVSVAIRSIALRSFDRDCADKICEVMQAQGVKLLHGVTPTSITRREDGRLDVEMKGADGKVSVNEVFDTVLYATGRRADTKGLCLSNAGVSTDRSGKVSTPNGGETTEVLNIHAVGDVLQNRPELTPVAIKAGELLARRLFGGATQKMDYELIPTTVFTPSEYGCVGLTEEGAAERYGADSVESYLWNWSTLEHAAVHRLKHASIRENEIDYMPTNCMAKLVCLKSENERVVGFHFVGPNAGEVTQGFALAVKCGATKEMFDNLIGIHPTDAEAFCSMSVSRSDVSSVADWTASGGCGGGKCG